MLSKYQVLGSVIYYQRVIKRTDISSAKYLNIWREQKTEEYLGNYFPLIVSAILRKWRKHTLKERKQQQSTEDGASRQQTKSHEEWKYRAPKPASGTTLRCWPTEGYKLGGNLKSWVRWKMTSVVNKPGWTGHGDALGNIWRLGGNGKVEYQLGTQKTR